MHGRVSQRKNRLNEGQLSEWMSQGGTELNNDLDKRNSAEKYRPALFGSCSLRSQQKDSKITYLEKSDFFKSPDKPRGYRTTLRKKEPIMLCFSKVKGKKTTTTATCQTRLQANYEPVSEVAIRRGTPQGDSLSPELFVIATFRLTCIHAIAGYFS